MKRFILKYIACIVLSAFVSVCLINPSLVRAAAAVGTVAAVIGCGVALSAKEPSGHLTSPGDAAKKAYEYNQGLKKQLGLPEDYEPQ
jgi:hypothetical protein